MFEKIPENCPVCGDKMEKGYVSATPDVYWSKKKVTLKFWRTRWEALLRGHFYGTMVNAEAYRCPNCKIVTFSYDEDGILRESASKVENVAR